MWAMLEVTPSLKDVCRVDHNLIDQLFELMF
jgi:hypothetical protein